MKDKGVYIPILIFFETRIMRLITFNETEVLSKGEKIYLKISDTYTDECIYKNSDSKLYELLKSENTKYKCFSWNNKEYLIRVNLKVGEKIIVDWGTALFTITKIFYKNGKCVELGKDDIVEELKNNLKCKLKVWI